jgi:hypothetical protein
MGEALRLNFDRRLLRRFLPALAMSFAGSRTAATQTGQSPVIVTRDNYARAETDLHFVQTVRGGGFGRLVHRRDMVSVDRQGVVRMNRDTLYSSGVFDLAAAPVTITLPDPGRRYTSLQVISEDQYTPLVAYAPGRYAIDEAQAGTRYAMLLVRTLADPRRTDDMAAAHQLNCRMRSLSSSRAPGRSRCRIGIPHRAKRCARNSLLYRGSNISIRAGCSARNARSSRLPT